MGNKKHIDRIFQEKFKNFEQQPDAKNWDAIKARLQQKKRRRPFIVWWRAAGVAAVLAVVISLIIGNQNGTNVNYTAKDYIHFDYKPLEEDRFTVSKKVQNALSIDIDALSQDELKKPSISQNKKVSVLNKNAKQSDPAKTDYKKVFQSTEQFVNQFNQSDKNTTNKGFQGTFNLADTKTDDLIPDDYTVATEVNLTGFLNAGLKKKSDSIPSDRRDKETQIAKNEDSKNLENNLTDEKSVENESKWLINPEVSPVFSGSFSGRNTLGADFATNETTNNVSFTYGINAGYQLSSKWRIISGIKQLNTRSTTKNILTANTTFDQGLAGSNLNQNNPDILVTSPSAFETLSTQNEGLGRVPTQKGSLEQQLNFIEVPVGLAYKLIDRKIGIEISGGASSLFVSQNEVFLNSGDQSQKIGSLSNVNSTSFMTNLGLGFDYNFNDQFDFNLRPTLKYQLNTFDSSTTDYQPYIIAIYTGFTYKF